MNYATPAASRGPRTRSNGAPKPTDRRFRDQIHDRLFAWKLEVIDRNAALPAVASNDVWRDPEHLRNFRDGIVFHGWCGHQHVPIVQVVVTKFQFFSIHDLTHRHEVVTMLPVEWISSLASVIARLGFEAAGTKVCV